jgi:sugar/nucleoside kinase (ribokinase family)
MTRDVSVVGPLNIDLVITGDGPPNWKAILNWDGPVSMEMTAAGSVGYTVRNLARLGLGVAVSSCVPDDALGTFLLESLRHEGVDVSMVQKVAGSLGGIGVYMLLFGSSKRPLAYRLPTHPLWPQRFTPNEVENMLDARALHSGGYLHFEGAWHGALVELFPEAKGRGLVTTLDPQFPLFDLLPPWMPALEDLLPHVDILFCDDHEARSITAAKDLTEAVRILLSAGPRTVVVKQGRDGSTVYQMGLEYHQAAIELGPPVDSIGAGDAYDAGFTLGILEGWPLERCALFAAIAAGFTVTGVGGSQTMPTRQAIDRELANHTG